MGRFTNSNLTDGGTNQNFGQVVVYEKWSLREVPLYLFNRDVSFHIHSDVNLTK